MARISFDLKGYFDLGNCIIQYSVLEFYIDDLYNFIYLFYSPLSASLSICTGMGYSCSSVLKGKKITFNHVVMSTKPVRNFRSYDKNKFKLELNSTVIIFWVRFYVFSTA